MKLMRVGIIAAVVVVALLGTSSCSYNRFVGQEEGIKTQWAQVENQLQRRNDLIPNLVETVKGITQQERHHGNQARIQQSLCRHRFLPLEAHVNSERLTPNP